MFNEAYFLGADENAHCDRVLVVTALQAGSSVVIQTLPNWPHVHNMIRQTTHVPLIVNVQNASISRHRSVKFWNLSMVYPVLHLIGLTIPFKTINIIHMIKKLSLLLIFFGRPRNPGSEAGQNWKIKY